jgi:hypothetical protein
MSMQWLDIACDWAERNDIPLTAYRSENDMCWYAKIDIRDGQGWFYTHVKIWPPGVRIEGEKKRNITSDEYQDNIEKELRSACQKARKVRMVAYSGREVFGKSA